MDTFELLGMNEVSKDRQLRTAYVTFESPLINTTIANSTFERDNNLTLVAVARNGKRIDLSPRDVVLRAGDTLLLECPPRMTSTPARSPRNSTSLTPRCRRI